MVVSTNEAFIKFIDTGGIVFDKGRPVNGLRLYTTPGKDLAYLSGNLNIRKLLPLMILGIQPVPGDFIKTILKTIPSPQAIL